jgi:hypothetical protein
VDPERHGRLSRGDGGGYGLTGGLPPGALRGQHSSKEGVKARHEGARDRVTHVNRSNLLAMPRGCYQHPPGSVFGCVMNGSTTCPVGPRPCTTGERTHGRDFSPHCRPVVGPAAKGLGSRATGHDVRHDDDPRDPR